MSNKKKLVVISPFTTTSGYGVHSRLIIRSLLSIPEVTDAFDVKLISSKWGNTPLTGLNASDPEDIKLFNLILPNNAIAEQPDVSIQISIPSEFQRIGKVSIGITAGSEVTVAPFEFVRKPNEIDFLIVPSQFTKDVLVGTKYDKKNEQGQIVETVQLNKPVEILFEGLDTTVFDKNNVTKSDLSDMLNDIQDQWCYLFCGHWVQGKLFEDRKDVGGLIYTFLNTFKKKKNKPALILKTSGAGFSITERDQLKAKINIIQEQIRSEGFSGKLPNIHLINGNLSDEQVNELYNNPKVKAMVSFTKGEGFGLPLLEFTSTGKPVICPNYSGQIDFLNPEFSFLLPGKLTTIDPSASNEWLPKEGQWFSVNYQYAGQILSDCFENYPKYWEKSRKHVKFTKDNFSLEKMSENFLEILKKYRIFEDSSTIEKTRPVLKLPQLKKIS